MLLKTLHSKQGTLRERWAQCFTPADTWGPACTAKRQEWQEHVKQEWQQEQEHIKQEQEKITAQTGEKTLWSKEKGNLV